MKPVFIYVLSDPRNGQVRYVGKTINLSHRLLVHLQERPGSHKNNWIKGLKAEGLKPIIEPLEVVTSNDENEWQEAERFWIETLRFYGCRLTNLDSGGHGGRSLSLESKLKISKANTGRVRTWEMKKRMSIAWHSSEKSRAHIKRISFENEGRTASDDTRAKISASQKGKKKSASAIAKMVQSRKGIVYKTRAPLSLEKIAEMKRKMREAWVKRRLIPISESTRLKMSISHKKYEQNKSLLHPR